MRRIVSTVYSSEGKADALVVEVIFPPVCATDHAGAGPVYPQGAGHGPEDTAGGCPGSHGGCGSPW